MTFTQSGDLSVILMPSKTQSSENVVDNLYQFLQQYFVVGYGSEVTIANTVYIYNCNMTLKFTTLNLYIN